MPVEFYIALALVWFVGVPALLIACAFIRPEPRPAPFACGGVVTNEPLFHATATQNGRAAALHRARAARDAHIDYIVSELGGRVDDLRVDFDGIMQYVTLHSGPHYHIRFSYQQLQLDEGLFEAIQYLGFGITGRGALRRAFNEEEAERKAWKLLQDNLSVEQRASLQRTGSFYVRGGDTGMVYRINRGTVSNIDVLNNGTVVEHLCVGPQGVTAAGDILLAQKIALECFEYKALGLANRSVAGLFGYGTHEAFAGDVVGVDPSGGHPGGANLDYEAEQVVVLGPDMIGEPRAR